MHSDSFLTFLFWLRVNARKTTVALMYVRMLDS
jgi:hypothetical protein